MEELMSVVELSKYLKVNPQTIYNWVSNNKIPYMKVGDLLRFKKTDIDDWLRKKTFYPDRDRYKEFEIEAIPHQHPETKKWFLNIRIWKKRGDQLVSRPFSNKEPFDSKEMAIIHCFILGRKIIDGEVENFSVDGM